MTTRVRRAPGRAGTPLATFDPETFSKINWTETLGKYPDLNPSTLARGAVKVVAWNCDVGHLYWKTVNNRVQGGESCLECQSIAYLHPEVAKEYSDENGIPATKVKPGSNVKAIWKCANGHTYTAKVQSRIQQKQPCGECRSISHLRPDLLIEWSEKNLDSSTKVSVNSAVKYEWVCIKGHSWKATPNNRNNGKGCPNCIQSGTSTTEQELRHLLSRDSSLVVLPFAPVTFREEKFSASGVLMTVDIVSYSPELRKYVLIEYDGYWHHKEGTVKRDIEKAYTFLEHEDVVFIKVRVPGLEPLDVEHERFTQIIHARPGTSKSLNEVVTTIEDWVANLR